MRKKKNKKKHKIRNIVLIIILGLIIIIGLLTLFKIDKIEVEGNENASDEEIIDYILTSKYDYHTFLFYVKSKFSDNSNIPFVETYEVELKSLTSIKINIYEKSVVGCIEYMGNYMYFDKEGIVLDSSKTALPDVPIVTGLNFEYIIIHEELPIDNKDVFNLLLDISQMLKKYKISVDRINLTSSLELELYIDEVKVELGTKEKLNEKVSNLKDIVELLEGRSGTFYMREYDETKKGYTFKND